MNRALKYKFIVASLITVSIASCASPATTKVGPKAGQSKLTEVKVPLPASSVFKPTSGNAVVNALHLVIKPQNDSCTNATKIDETRSYNDATLAQKIAKGCDYFVTLALGEKSSSGTFTAYYENANSQSVTQSELNSSPAKISLTLAITSAGRAANLPTSVTIPDTQPQTDPTPTPSPTPIPTPTPGTDLAQLPTNLASANLTGVNSKQVKLESLFTTKYLLIDYSQLGCGYCVQHSQEMNSDSGFQKMMDGTGKCKSITVVSTSQVNDWVSQFDRNLNQVRTFAGRTSYGYSGGATSFGRLFGVTITGTPTVQLVDRSGKVVVQDGRSNPQAVERFCQ